MIGKKGEDIENAARPSCARCWACRSHVNIEEVRKPEIDAQLIADSITQQLEKRIMFRRAMKRAMQNAMRLGAQGIKIMSAGRLNGIEIARTRVVSRRPRAAAHAARRHRLRLLRSQDDLRRHRHQGAGSSRATGSANGEAPSINTPAGAEDDRRNRRGPRPGGPARPRPPPAPARATGPPEPPAPTPTADAAAAAAARRPTTRRTPAVKRVRKAVDAAADAAKATAKENKHAATSRRKYRKEQKGRNTGVATRGAKVSFGDFGLKATERGRLTARQIEAARRAMTRHIKRGGRIWIRIFPDKPISQKPAEVRMGNGKGNPEYYVAEIQPGKVLYEMDGVHEAAGARGVPARLGQAAAARRRSSRARSAPERRRNRHESI